MKKSCFNKRLVELVEEREDKDLEYIQKVASGEYAFVVGALVRIQDERPDLKDQIEFLIERRKKEMQEEREMKGGYGSS